MSTRSTMVTNGRAVVVTTKTVAFSLAMFAMNPKHLHRSLWRRSGTVSTGRCRSRDSRTDPCPGRSAAAARSSTRASCDPLQTDQHQ